MKNHSIWLVTLLMLLASAGTGLEVSGKAGGKGKGKSEATPLETDHAATGQIDPDGLATYQNSDAGVTISLERGRYEFTMQCTETTPCTRTFSLNLQPTVGPDACDVAFIVNPARLSLFVEDVGAVTGTATTTARAQFREMTCDFGDCFSTGSVYTLTWDSVTVEAEAGGGWTIFTSVPALIQLGSKKRAPKCEVSANFALSARPV